MARMKIFNTLEKESFESPPMFNSADRKRFFSLPMVFTKSMKNLRTPTNKVCFLMAAGYFKARRKFFGRQFLQADIEYVARRTDVDLSEVHIEAYNRATRVRHQRIILSHFGFVPFDEVAKMFIVSEIATLVRVQYRPKMVLLEIIQILTRQKIEIPSYNVLADLIVTAINPHRRALSDIVNANLSEKQRAALESLLEKEPDNGTSEGWRYRLTLLKRPFQSTRPSKIRVNLADLNTLQTIYLDLKPVVQRLKLSYECTRYYAYSVIKAQIPQISCRADNDCLLYLIAFVAYQTFKLNDTLIDTLLSAVQTAVNAATKAHKEIYFQEREQRSQSLSTMADKLRQTAQ